MTVIEKIEKMPKAQRVYVKDLLDEIKYAKEEKTFARKAVASHLFYLSEKLYPKMDAVVKMYIDNEYMDLVANY